ncbi:hypothetical protein SAMN05661080_04386 [Modestobacter sp. DSM 44400]|nr:hypothetical protein SAMN05661080_04386 [Modestobacter sp. DSM 44400]
MARGWNVEMARRGQLKHQDIRAPLERESLSDLDGVGVGVGVGVGKNIFQATGPVPAGAMHAGWMRSDGHRVNVLNPGWDRLGVAVLCAENGSVWATREFGRSAGADLPEIAEETPPAESVVPPEDDGPRCG